MFSPPKATGASDVQADAARNRRFARPEALRVLRQDVLRRLILEMGGFDAATSARLAGDPIPFQELAEQLAAGAPTVLVEGLYYAADFLGQHDAADRLAAALVGRGANLGPRAGNGIADMVLLAWLDEDLREVVRQVHAESCHSSARTFDAWHTASGAIPRPPDLGVDAREALRLDLEAFYDLYRGCAGVRVFLSERAGDVWIVVREPEAWARVVFVGPDGEDDPKEGHREAFVAAIYHPSVGQLSVHARSNVVATRLREAIGQHLFGDPGLFSVPGQVTLEPLRLHGRASLAVDDIEGIDSITLRAFELRYANANADRVVRSARDLFASSVADLPTGGRLRYADFDVRYAGQVSECSVRLYSGARTRFDRDEGGAALRDWMVARGFLQSPRAFSYPELRPLWGIVAEHGADQLTRVEWDAMGAGTAPLLGMLLQPAGGPAASVPCPFAQGGCRRERSDTPAGLVYRCSHEAPRCAPVAPSKAEAAAWQVQASVLATLLARALAPETPALPIRPPGGSVWRVADATFGALGASFLALVADHRDIGGIVADLRALGSGGRTSVLFLPTLSRCSHAVLALARRDDVVLVGLDEVGTLHAGDLRLDLWTLLTRVAETHPGLDPTPWCADRFGLLVDPDRHRYWWHGTPVRFGAKETAQPALLEALAIEPGRPLDHAEFATLYPAATTRSSAKSWPKYKEKLVAALDRAAPASAPAADQLVRASGDGTYTLDLPHDRVGWWPPSSRPAR